MKVKMQVEEKLDGCDALVIGEDHDEECYSGWGQDSVPVIFRILQSNNIIFICQCV